MNTIPLINNAPSTNFSMNKLNAVDKSGVRSAPVNDAQLRQEVNTSIVALEREAFSLETLINKAAQELTNLNNRIAAIEQAEGDYVKKSDVVDTVSSGNMNPVTSEAVNNINFQGVKYGANYDCNTIGDGLALINGQTLNSPYKQGISTYELAYILTRSISNDNRFYRMQIVINYLYNNMFTRTYTDNGWSVWKKVVMDADLTIHTWRKYVNHGTKVYIHRDIATAGDTPPKWIKLILSFHGSFGDATRISEYLVRLNYTPYSDTNYRGLTPVLVAGLNSTTTGYDALSNVNATLGWDASGIYINNQSSWANLIVDVISPYSET